MSVLIPTGIKKAKPVSVLANYGIETGFKNRDCIPYTETRIRMGSVLSNLKCFPSIASLLRKGYQRHFT